MQEITFAAPTLMLKFSLTPYSTNKPRPCNFRHTLSHKRNKQPLVFDDGKSCLLTFIAASSKSLVMYSGE